MHLNGVDLDPARYPTDDAYPFNLTVLSEHITLRFEEPVTLFVGENGSGKSTVLSAIARRCRVHQWRLESRQRVVNNPWEDRLGDFIRIKWAHGRVPGSYFGSDTFNDFAVILDEWAHDDPGQLKYFGGESLLTQSHGQSLMSYFRARYPIKGLYLLDEPETALSPRTQLELLELLVECARGGDSQFIIATHSPILLACPNATIFSFDGGRIAPIKYEETDHYQLYRDFMADPGQYVDRL
ncbi:MAG: AAA family ATPase [Armatimonadota bacterium]